MTRPSNKSTILIADTPGQLLLMELMLASEEHQVVKVEDGREVLAYLRSHTPDLIILDINMPYLSGLDLCARVKHVQRLKNIPVILVTSLRDQRVKGSEPIVKPDAVLEKPLDSTTFRETINRFLESPIVSPDPLSRTRSPGEWSVSKY